MSLHHSPSIVTDGLILYLDAANQKSYSGSGLVWNDLSSNNINGTFAASPTVSNGFATFIQGSSQIVTFPNDSKLHFLNTSPFTLECMLRINTLTAPSTFRRVMQREGNPGSGRDGYTFWINGASNGTSLQFRLERFVLGSAVIIGIDLPFPGDGSSWNHWVISYSGSQLRMYRNANLVAGPTTDTRTITNTTTSFVVGSGGSTNTIGGDISYAKVYSKELSATEIQQNFNALRGRFGL
jgi:hypothetical protein